MRELQSKNGRQGLQAWFTALPAGLTIVAPFVDKLALDGLIVRAIRGFQTLSRAFWSFVESFLPFRIPIEWKDTLTLAALLVLPTLFQLIWRGQMLPVAEGRLFERKDGLFKNRALRRYTGIAIALLLMVAFLADSDLPVQLYAIGLLIAGFSTMVSWRAPIAIVIWGSTFLAAALFEEHVRPIIVRYFEQIGI